MLTEEAKARVDLMVSGIREIIGAFREPWRHLHVSINNPVLQSAFTTGEARRTVNYMYSKLRDCGVALIRHLETTPDELDLFSHGTFQCIFTTSTTSLTCRACMARK